MNAQRTGHMGVIGGVGESFTPGGRSEQNARHTLAWL